MRIVASSTLFLFFPFFCLILNWQIQHSVAISCFECTSYNHDNPECEDPFLRANSVQLSHDCLTGIPNKNGSFRATHCLKLVAKGHGFHYVVRKCSIDMGTGRIEREISSMNHCGFLSLANFYTIVQPSSSSSSSHSRSEQHHQQQLHFPSENSTSVSENATATTPPPTTTNTADDVNFFDAQLNIDTFRGCLSVCARDECNTATPSSIMMTPHHLSLLMLLLLAYFLLVSPSSCASFD